MGKSSAGEPVLARELRLPSWPEGPQEGAETVRVGVRWNLKLWASRVKSFLVGPGVSSLLFFEEEKGAILDLMLGGG